MKRTASAKKYKGNQKRKARIRQITALLSLIVLLGIAVLHFTAQNTQAESEETASSYKYFTCIRVEYGDTLWDIAKEYRTEEYTSIQSYIEEVKSMNHLTSDRITDGMYLCIPYYATEYKA